MKSVPIKAKYLRAFLFPKDDVSLYGLADRLDFYSTGTPREIKFIGELQYKLAIK